MIPYHLGDFRCEEQEWNSWKLPFLTQLLVQNNKIGVFNSPYLFQIDQKDKIFMYTNHDFKPAELNRISWKQTFTKFNSKTSTYAVFIAGGSLIMVLLTQIFEMDHLKQPDINGNWGFKKINISRMNTCR